jgi:putative spermidine/putrescine transport system permease protein
MSTPTTDEVSASTPAAAMPAGVVGRPEWMPRLLPVIWTMPLMLLLGLFFLAPLVEIIRHAFTGENGLAEWWEVITSPGNASAIKNTFVISLQVTLICTVLSYVYVQVLLAAPRRLKTVLLFAVLVPFFTSVLVRSYAWIILLGGNGPVSAISRALFGTDAPLLYNRAGLLIGMVHVLLPYFILPLYAVMLRAPAHLVEAARTLGATRVQAFVRVFVPLSLPGAAAGAVLVFITSMGFFVTPSLLGGANDVMIAQAIEREFRVVPDLTGPAVLSIVLVLAVIAVILGLRLFYPMEVLFIPESLTSRSGRRMRRIGSEISAGVVLEASRKTVKGLLDLLDHLPWRFIARVGVVAIVGFLILPLTVVVPVSFSGDPFLRFPPGSLSLRWYDSVLGDELWRNAFVNSFATGLIAIAIVTIVGVPVAFTVARSRMKQGWKGLILSLSFLPVIVPTIVLAIGVFLWYLRLDLIGGRVSLAIAHATLGLPFLIVTVAAALRDFDQRLELAARSLGANALHTLRSITLRLIAPSIGVGLLFAFLMSWDELLIARGVTDLSTETLPLRLWNGARDEISPALAVVSTISIGVTLVLVAAAQWFTTRRQSFQS